MRAAAVVVAVMAMCGLARAESRTDDSELHPSSPGVFIVDADGHELYARHADTARPIASLTKIFVAMVVRAHGLDLDDWTRINGDDAAAALGGAGTYFRRGESFRNIDLLHAMLMVSDNRVPTALARSVGLSPSQLLHEMNALASSLGLVHTQFDDVTGITGNRSTAREMAAALHATLDDHVLARIMRTRYARIHSSDDRQIDIKSTVQPLWGKRNHIRGGKTGTTEGAGHCLLIETAIGDRVVTMAFMGGETARSRFLDYAKAMHWLGKLAQP